MGLQMINFDILWVHRKIWFLRGGVYKKTIYRGDCLKRSGLGQFADLRGAWQIEVQGWFLGGVDTLMHTMIEQEYMENVYLWRRWILNPVVPCSKQLGGSKFDSAFHPAKVDKMSNRNFTVLSDKKQTASKWL